MGCINKQINRLLLSFVHLYIILVSVQIRNNMKNRLLTIVLAVLLGGFGIHRFYLRDYMMGFIYLISFWTGIPTIIAWIEAVYFLIIGEKEFHRKYG